METISEMTGLTPEKIKNFGLLAAGFCMILGVGEEIVTIAVGIAYPAFMSFLALETKRTDDDKKWLTYWLSYGAFNILDHFSKIITQFIPFYLTFKVLFLIWMMHSSTEGALTIYNNLILPNVEKYKSEIEEAEKRI